MANFQTAVSLYSPANVTPGTLGANNPLTTLSGSPFSTLDAGKFAWTTVVSGVFANAGGTGTTAPIGIVQAVLSKSFWDTSTGGTITYTKEDRVTIVTSGTLWVVVSTSAAVGAVLYVNPLTGVINALNPGTTLAGFVETKWAVVEIAQSNLTVTSAPAGTPILVSL